jgi:dihydrofolate reductase
MSEQMGKPFDLLLGRKTYEIFASYWPQHNDEIGGGINKATKYVVSTTDHMYDWEKTVIVKDNVVEQVKKLKEEDGHDLQVHGSGNSVWENAYLIKELFPLPIHWLNLKPHRLESSLQISNAQEMSKQVHSE